MKKEKILFSPHAVGARRIGESSPRFGSRHSSGSDRRELSEETGRGAARGFGGFINQIANENGADDKRGLDHEGGVVGEVGGGACETRGVVAEHGRRRGRGALRGDTRDADVGLRELRLELSELGALLLRELHVTACGEERAAGGIEGLPVFVPGLPSDEEGLRECACGRSDDGRVRRCSIRIDIALFVVDVGWRRDERNVFVGRRS